MECCVNIFTIDYLWQKEISVCNKFTYEPLNKDDINLSRVLKPSFNNVVLTIFFTVSAELDREYTSRGDVSVLSSISSKKFKNQSEESEIGMEATAQHDNSLFVCPRCCKVYQLYPSLRRHMRVECGKEPRHACPYCGRKFKHRFNLLVHMRNLACRKE